jgi:hypothetical protein
VTAYDRSAGVRPWAVDEQIRLLGTWVIATAVLVACWVGAATTVVWGHEMIAAAVAVASLGLSGWGAARWLLAGTRAVRDSRGRVMARVDSLADRWAPAGAEPTSAGERVVALAGLRYFHRPDCALVADRKVTASTRARQEAGGRLPCGVCRP